MVTNDCQGKGTSQASKLNTPQQSRGSHRPRNTKKLVEKAMEPKKNMQSKAPSKKIPVVKTSEVSKVADRAMLTRWQVFHTPEQLIRSLITKKLARSTSLSGQPARMRTSSSWMTKRRLTSRSLSSHQPLSTFDQRRIKS